MNVFDIIGPVMIGPSSAHTAGRIEIQGIGGMAVSFNGEADYFPHRRSGSFADITSMLSGQGGDWSRQNEGAGIRRCPIIAVGADTCSAPTWFNQNPRFLRIYALL